QPEEAPVPPAVPGATRAIVPLMLQMGATGVLLLDFDAPRPVAAADIDFMLTLGRQSAQAFERARLYAAQHHMAATLQRALLPAGMPEVPGIRLCAVYLPS